MRATPGGEVALKLRPQHRAPVSVRESLVAFHKTHYSANAMRLVVVGREPLDTLQAWVVPLFSKVPNIDRLPPVWGTLPYGPAQLGRELKVVPPVSNHNRRG